MKTYETEKQKMPEGAERYFNQDSSNYFAWYKKVDGKFMVMVIDNSSAHYWDFCNYSEYDRATPIYKPKYRYEKVTDSIFDLKEEFERGELYAKNKNKDKYYPINGESWLVSAANNGNVHRRIEVTERELWIQDALEAGQFEDRRVDSQEYIAVGKIYDKLVNGKG